MNLRSLEYLVALKRHKHFGKASQACFVSQPTLSMQIKKLEERLDVKLLERNNKRVMLTAIGEDIASHAELVLNEIKTIKELAATAQNPFKGELHLGVIPTLAPYLLPIILPAIQQSYPDLILHLVEAKTDQLINMLDQGKIDAIILALPITQPQFESNSLFEEPFQLMVSNQHPWHNKKSISQQELVDQQLLLLDEGHCLREQALEVCHLQSNSQEANYRATSLETLKQLVAANHGITLLPQLACKNLTKNSKLIEFKSPKPKREIGLVWRKTTIKRPILDGITDIMRSKTKETLA